MAENKKSFLLYCDLIHMVKKLPDEKAGELFKHILSYVNDEHPVSDDLIINISFEPIKQQLKRDLVKFENVCNRNRHNGLMGGRPKKEENPEEPKKPTGLIGNPKKPKKPDNDIDNDTDIDNDIKIKDSFSLFWDHYHNITKIDKTDKEPALKYWNKIPIIEQRKAYIGVEKYFKSLKDKNFCKKARTYLSDKAYNNEYNSQTDMETYLNSIEI